MPALRGIGSTRYGAAGAGGGVAEGAGREGTVPAGAGGDLWGVPMGVKEGFEVPGLPFTAGSASLLGQLGTEAGSAMRRLQEAGIIILGTTNVSEGCMFHESANPVYGTRLEPPSSAASHRCIMRGTS